MKKKEFVHPGDAIHIYHMFGEPNYRDREGVVTFIDDIGNFYYR